MTERLRLTVPGWRRVLDRCTVSIDWGTRLRYQFGSNCYSALLKLQEAAYKEALATVVPKPPIFLLGFWRSGTTFLHELFCSDQQFAFPSTYACLNPTHFLLSEKWIQNNVGSESVARPMDDMRYSWLSPQEDEFALMILGARSPYEVLVVPSLMNDPHTLLNTKCHPQAETDEWARIFNYFLRLVAVQNGKPILLKSPPHGFRMSLLIRLFPEARFVVIERNPFEVFASNLKLWRTLLEMYSLEPFTDQQIENFVLSAYIIHEEAIDEGIKKVTDGRVARVRYEDLVANPVSEIERLYRELDLTNFDEMQPSLVEHLAKVANHKRNRFVLSAKQKERVESLWGATINKKQYEWSQDQLTLAPDG